MEPRDLFNIWNAPDHSKLTPKQISIRLPIQVAAKINTLCDIFPNKTKTQIISDLLATALDQFEAVMPSSEGKKIRTDKETGRAVYEDIGLRGMFLTGAEFHLREYEKELGIKEPMPFPEPIIIGKKK